MSMTQDDLRKKFTKATRIAKAEKKQREWVFRNDPVRRDAKVAEMDELIAILVEFKDELKAHIGAEIEQPRLLDVPRKAEYN